MAWTNSAWPSQATAVARLAMLRLYIGEVADAMGMGGALSVGGRSRDPQSLQRHYDNLLDRLPKHERDAAAELAAASGRQTLRTFGIRFKGVPAV